MPIVVVSAEPYDPAAVVDAVVAKPFRCAELLDAVRPLARITG